MKCKMQLCSALLGELRGGGSTAIRTVGKLSLSLAAALGSPHKAAGDKLVVIALVWKKKRERCRNCKSQICYRNENPERVSNPAGTFLYTIFHTFVSSRPWLIPAV